MLKEFCNVIETLAGHGMQCLQCSYTNNVTDLLPYDAMQSFLCLNDVMKTSSCQGT